MNKILAYIQKFLLAPIKSSFNRFPEIFVELIILAGALIYDNRVNNYNEDYRRIITSTIIGLALLIIYHIGVILAAEKYQLKKLTRALLGLGVVAFATIYGFYYFSQWTNIYRFFLSFRTSALIVSGVTLFLTIPYFFKRNNFSVYVPYILTRALITIFYTAALILGTIGIISLFGFLFQLNINNDLYGDITILFATLVGGPLFLGNIPMISKNLSIKDYGIVWKVLIARIVIPLASIATLIIFAYATIGRLTGVYDGNIFLVSAFSSLSAILVAIVLSEPFEKEINYVKLFRKYLPYPMLLLVLNLGIEIILEINRTGLSVNNFITGLFTDFFAGAFLFLLLKRYYKPIFIPLILSATLLIGGFTPYVNIEAWSFRSTVNQLNAALTDLNMLNNDQLTPRTDLSDFDKQKISRLLSELSSYHGFSKISYLPANFEINRTKDVFGFEYYYFMGDETIYVSLGSKFSSGVDISGYDRSYELFVYKTEANSMGIYEARISGNDLILRQGATIVASLPLETIVRNLYNQYGASRFEIPIESLEYSFDNPKFKLVIRNISATVNNNGVLTLDSINGFILVKE